MENKQLTYTEKETLKLIQADIAYFVSNKLKDLANKYNVGEATLIRLVHKLNFDSLKNMQISYAKIFNNFENTEDIFLKVAGIEVHSVSETLKNINHKDVHLVSQLIIDSKQVVVFGIENSHFSALYLSGNLKKIGINSFTHVSIHGAITHLSFLEPKETVVLIFSASGKTKESNCLGELCTKNKIPFVWISSTSKDEKSPLNAAIVNIQHSEYVNEPLKFPSISTSVGQFFISNLIFNYILNIDKNLYAKLQQSDDNVAINWNEI